MNQAPPAPLVGVLILNWNGLQDTCACLASLADSVYPRWQAFVLDNGSQADEAAALRARFPAVTVLAVERNRGYAGGHNQLVPLALAAGCEFLLLLNNDTLVPPDMIGQAVDAYRQAPVPGLLAVRERQTGPCPPPDRVGARYRPLTCQVVWCHAKPEASLPPLQEFAVVSGCAVLTGREALAKVGGLEEEFFAYWEDVDWSLRMRAAGRRNYCLTTAHVLHHSGASTGRERGPNLPQLYLVCRGQALLTHRHARGLGRVLSPLRALAGLAVTAVRSLIQPALRPVARAKARGWLDGYRRRPPSTDYIR